MACVHAVNRHMNNRTGLLTRMPGSTDILHELFIADVNNLSIDMSPHAASSNLFYIFDLAVICLVFIGIAQRSGDWMHREAFNMSRQMQEFLRIDFFRMNGCDFKNTFCQSTRLIKDNGIYFREGLQIIGTLDEHALAARTANAGKERQRNANDERTGAADDEKGQGTVNPCAPFCFHAHAGNAHERRYNG